MTNLLEFIGKGSAFNAELVNNSAFFKDDENKEFYLIDCGNTVFNELVKTEILEKYKEYNFNVIITHIHSDHIGSLGTLIEYLFYNYNKKVNIISPITTNVNHFVNILNLDEKAYDFIELKQEDLYVYSYKLNNTKIRFIKTEHVPTLNCYSLLIEVNNDKIYYTSDSVETLSKHLNKIKNEEISDIFIDVSFKEENPVHLTFNKLKEDVKNLNKKNLKINLMHTDESLEYTEKMEKEINEIK